LLKKYLGILNREASSSLGRPSPLLTTYGSSSTHIYAPGGFLSVAPYCLFSCTVTDLSGKLISYHTKILMIPTAFFSHTKNPPLSWSHIKPAEEQSWLLQHKSIKPRIHHYQQIQQFRGSICAMSVRRWLQNIISTESSRADGELKETSEASSVHTSRLTL